MQPALLDPSGPGVPPKLHDALRELQASNVTTDAEYETTLKTAEKALNGAQTAEDIRHIWKENSGALGHRTLGRLLMGTPASRHLERRAARAERDE